MATALGARAFLGGGVRLEGVRGFGAFGRFAPAHRGRADGILTTATPWELGHRGLSLLIAGLDHESSRRYAEASADMIALALAEIGAIAQRRIALIVDPTLSFDLPPFLTPDPGLNSGLLIAEVTPAASSEAAVSAAARAGTEAMARSTSCGRSAMDGVAVRPSIVSADGCTGRISPV